MRCLICAPLQRCNLSALSDKISNFITATILASKESNQTDVLWGTRQENWAALGQFLANFDRIGILGSYVEKIIDRMIDTYNGPIHGKSVLCSEISTALSCYRKNDERQAKIQQSVKINRPLQPVLPTNLPPPMDMGFTFDLSYYGYSSTIYYLERLVSLNLPKAKQMITPEKRQDLENLLKALRKDLNLKLDNNEENKKTKTEAEILEKILTKLATH